MKKNILLLLIPLLFFMTVGAQAQEWWSQDSCCDEDNYYYEDSCCYEDNCYYEDSCCYEDNCCVDETGFYAKVLAGANFLHNTTTNGNKSSYETGYIVSGSLGYCWCYGLRVEGEYTYRRNSIKKIHLFGEGSSKRGHVQTSSYMANLLWDLPLSSWGCTCWNIQPFIGAGIGYDFQQIHSSTSRVIFNQKWNQFSWQLMAGLVYPIFCNTELSLEYKFHQGPSHFYNQSVGIGLTYKFGFLR